MVLVGTGAGASRGNCLGSETGSAQGCAQLFLQTERIMKVLYFFFKSRLAQWLVSVLNVGGSISARDIHLCGQQIVVPGQRVYM